MRGPDEWSERAWRALALALPLLLLALHHHQGHDGDIAFFHEWYLAVREGGAFYRDGPGINYPIVGVLLVAGPARLIDLALGAPLSLPAYWLVLKLTLVAGETTLLLLAARLARTLGHDRPRLLALVLALLPSSWAGGAWFGQIDVWGTVALLSAADAAVTYDRTGRLPSLLAALALLMTAILIKQLTWFAVPLIAALVLRGMWGHRQRAHVLCVLASPLLLVLADPFLTLPDGARSHLFFVLTHGSSHGDLVAASGASLWSLVFVGGVPSSDITWLGIDARAWGWIAHVLAMGAVLALIGRARPVAARTFVLAAGLGQLFMALVLTGVHERYLAHAIPLLWLARGEAPPRTTVVLGIAVAIASGLFVLSTITPEMPELFGRPQPVALLALAWATALVTELAHRRG